MPCGIRAPRTCWKAARICAQSRKCWAIPAFLRPNATRTCRSTSCSRYTTGRTPWHRLRGNRRSVAMVQPANPLLPPIPRRAAPSDSSFDRMLKAGSGAVLGATLGLVGVSALDCSYGRAGQFAARWLADLGLLAPLALLLGLTWAAVRLFFHGGAAPNLVQAFAAFRGLDSLERARHNASFLITPGAFVGWLVIAANLATRLLGSDVPARAAGAALALSLLATFWVGVQLVASAIEALVTRRRVSELDPVYCALLGVALGALLFAYAVWTGTPGGAGFPFGVFGVFKRPELDLRAPGLLLLLSLAAYSTPNPRRRSLALGGFVPASAAAG